jgi:hypothetical protein
MSTNQTANQRSRSPELQDIQPPPLDHAFVYEPLDPDVDCIRVVDLTPEMTDSDSPVSCSLRHVTFGQKPMYEALSYTWGNDGPRMKILINDKDFFVGEPLYRALRCVRARKEVISLWVDAICINQDDVEERNRQVRIMPHIYTRAKTVLVWLNIHESEGSSGAWNRLVARGHASESKWLTDSEDDFFNEICSNSYWDRVWIIQELGKARVIRILFAHLDLAWTSFIGGLAGRHIEGDPGPLRMDRQIKSKYNGGHTLQYLLKVHQRARCKDPRDKIYGFVGLATDCYAFPIDYQRSLLQVWMDTIVFASQNDMVANIALFGQLVKNLLEDSGERIATVKAVHRAYSQRPRSSFPAIIDDSDKGVVKIPIRHRRLITYVGPTLGDMVSTLAETDRWTSKVREVFHNDIDSVNEENDRFVQAIEELDGEKLARLIFRHAGCKWVDDDWGILWTRVPISKHQHQGLRLVQFEEPIEQGGKLSRMGIASPNVKENDFICTVPYLAKKVLVRREKQAYQEKDVIQVIGTALLSDTVIRQNQVEEVDLTDNDVVANSQGWGRQLLVDAETAYVLFNTDEEKSTG